MTGPRSYLSMHLVSVGALVVTAAACGDRTQARACGPIERQPLDPVALVRALVNGSAVEYATDPPTYARRRSSLDVDALRAFIRDRVGKDPDG